MRLTVVIVNMSKLLPLDCELCVISSINNNGFIKEGEDIFGWSPQLIMLIED